MKEREKVKNYCKDELEPNSIFPRAYHIIDGLWFIATQNTHTHHSQPSETKGTLIVNPAIGIIKLNMSCTATSHYIT